MVEARRGVDRGDRCRDPRRGLSDGPVRADGPRRDRRQPRRGAWRLGRASAGPTGSDRRRSRSGSSRRAGSAGRPAPASTGTRTGDAGAVAPEFRRRPPRRLAQAAIAERIVLAVVNEAWRALEDGVATQERHRSRAAARRWPSDRPVRAHPEPRRRARFVAALESRGLGRSLRSRRGPARGLRPRADRPGPPTIRPCAICNDRCARPGSSKPSGPRSGATAAPSPRSGRTTSRPPSSGPSSTAPGSIPA